MKASVAALSLCVLLPGTAAAQGEPLLMSAPWARLACDAWNAEPALTGQLVESGWVKNDAKRGFKVLQIYRTDCADSPRVELRIAERPGGATACPGRP